MKKYSLIILLFISFHSYSQTFGVKGGVSISKERATASGITVTSESLVSPMFGVYGEVATSNEALFFSPEMIYSVEGGSFDIAGFSGKDKLSFLSLPLLMKYYASDNFSLHLGPQIGILLNAKSELNGEELDFTDDVNRLSLSFDLGGEVHLSGFNLGARYVIGLTDLNATANDDSQLKINSIQIFLAVPF